MPLLHTHDSLLAEGYSKRDFYKVKDMSTGLWVRGHQRLNHLLDQVTLSSSLRYDSN